ncbi:DUF397 domain-containing protein [Streptomyces sp. DSM 42041]|uniref:DUF397 domain-containing protein n=1 Tax=Streptomyces hazeniae TaxID=3075538 RepID=A0ABU2NKU7_9ACTN|nr:DUF397 domain-containing protein [Streptomyces sp. DSM 42041]MDT0377621.1 DUF397 domain-containing protein [Streptomyces sp. DSM 42041]
MYPLNSIEWQKSSFSGGGEGAECLEVSQGGHGYHALRESDDQDIHVHASPAALAGLIRHVKRPR